MPGVLSHVGVAIVGFLVLYFISHNWKYGLAWVVGTLIPDSIKFGIPALRLQTSSFTKMMTDPFYGPLNNYTHHIHMWIVLCVFVLVLTLVLYKFKKIKWKTFKTWLIINACFFASIVVHLIMDHFIIEKSYWI